MSEIEYPPVRDPERIGEYPALSHSGGGYVWDEVLEYRVWLHPERGAEDLHDGEDYYYAFDNGPEAAAFSASAPGAEPPLALILQEESVMEPSPGVFEWRRSPRVTEWRVEWLAGSRRGPQMLARFFADDAPQDPAARCALLVEG